MRTKNPAGRYALTRKACFLTSFSTALTSNLPPLLFLTFKNLYGISYSLLGFLVVLNFGTQMLMDALFSFFSHKFNMKWAVRMMPTVMFLGMWIFAGAPILFPLNPYIGLALGTVIFSAGSGLTEVLVSPVIAAIPSENSGRMMSRLHSCYAWGVLALVVAATAFIRSFGANNWQLLTLLLSLLPLIAAVMLLISPIPAMETPERSSDAVGMLKNPTVLYFVFCIFLGGATECAMSQWCSSYLEMALGIPKTVGDLFGFALFGAMLGLGRSLYGRIGRNIHSVLLTCAASATACYVTAVVSGHPIVGLAACALTGLCVSMLWPGTLIAMAEVIPNASVALYALMAMGGDIGAAACPQAMGLITDGVLQAGWAADLAQKAGLTAEQLGMKAGMAFAALFPLALTVLYVLNRRRRSAKT